MPAPHARKRTTFLLAVLASTLAAATPAVGLFSRAQYDCYVAIDKAGASLDRARLRLEAKCRTSKLVTGSCTAVPPQKLEALDQRFVRKIEQHCGELPPERLSQFGFPCDDPDLSDPYQAGEMAACLLDIRHSVVATVVDGIYDPDLAMVASADRKCLSKVSGAVIGVATTRMRALAACRERIVALELGIRPEHCSTETVTKRAIDKAQGRLTDEIYNRCTNAQIEALRFCTPDATTWGTAESRFFTLLDYQYAGEPVCGDNRTNGSTEECDGPDDAACPGFCGAWNGPFACLCIDRPLQHVSEPAGGDLDVGWTGAAHDQAGSGGSYLVDLAGCDGAAGPDTECLVGPHCSAPPHSPCSPSATTYESGDAICAALGEGTCGKTLAAAVGPHCAIDLQKRCASDLHCPTPGDFCEKTAHGAPVALAFGGVSLCVSHIFSEDVVGTVDAATGATSVRLRRHATVQSGGGVDQPCPVCGGFCEGASGSYDPGQRTLCTSDADCSIGAHCITEPVCSYGPRADWPCRSFGAVGGPSIDCPSGGLLLSTQDVLLDPLTTGTTALAPLQQCADAAYRQNVCDGGGNALRPCTSDPECPGGACREQCHCAGQAKPNACAAACVGGANDAAPCATDAECDPPNGFCHAADCRRDLADDDSSQEGRCTTGPLVGHCSLSTAWPCELDEQCRPPSCPACTPAETCIAEPSQCFVSGTITRTGVAGIPDRTLVGITCLPSTDLSAADSVAGLPGPAAVSRPETVHLTP